MNDRKKKNIYKSCINKTLFLFYLIICLCFSAGANLNSSNPDPSNPISLISGYDIAEITCLFIILINNCVTIFLEKKFNFFILFCLLFPLVLIILKLIINTVSDVNTLIIINGCFRMIMLYLSFIFNFMNINDILPLIYESTDTKQLIDSTNQKKTTENKKIKDGENRILINDNPIIISPRRNSFTYLNENSQLNRFPILLQTKVKLPIFVSFNVTTDFNEKFSLPDHGFIEELSILYKQETINNINLQDKYSELICELNRIGDIDFNVFNVSEYSNNLELMVMMNHLFRLYNFEHLGINKDVFKNYFYHVNVNYRKNPYHNSIHATDVVQTFYFLSKTCNIDIICNLSELEIFYCFFSGAIHDVDHPGNNNLYEIAVQSCLALSYNDKAVLENYHLYKAFSILRKPESDVFANFDRETYSRTRARIINIVLTTDMAVHFSELANLNNRIKANDFDPTKTDKDMLLNQLIHACDISNPTKPFDIYQLWVNRVFQEFFNQGDKEREKGLKISFLCDRNTTNIPTAQIGFIEGIVFPFYEALCTPFPNLKMIGNIISNNKMKFKEIKEKEAKI